MIEQNVICFVQFIDEPLAYLTVHYTRLASWFSPDAMSLLGVVVAAISARFMVQEELRYRQLGVLLFSVRDYIDALDGTIYRERKGVAVISVMVGRCPRTSGDVLKARRNKCEVE